MSSEFEKFTITISLAQQLVGKQFPQWSHLPVTPVAKGGWDNVTFHLGDSMLLRLPSALSYTEQVLKEHTWLPQLAPHLPTHIPQPIALGKPSTLFPYHWSVYNWIEGETATTLHPENLPQFARDIAHFLTQLHRINATGGPMPEAHNCLRGASPIVYDEQTRMLIENLKAYVDAHAATQIWNEAVFGPQWSKNPVWIHGDLSASNILVKDGMLTAVIDFGCMGIGDPACDLVLAWTFLDTPSRAIFKTQLALDNDTWARARGWCLWKALFELNELPDKNDIHAQKQLKIIRDVMQS